MEYPSSLKPRTCVMCDANFPPSLLISIMRIQMETLEEEMQVSMSYIPMEQIKINNECFASGAMVRYSDNAKAGDKL